MEPIRDGASASNEGTFPRRLGPYVLLSFLDEGGMGRVYLALAPDGEQLRVLKRFGNPRSDFSPEQILENQERFRREAQITMALSHPCIARTFSTLEDGSESYLVQEFVDGMTMDYLTSSLSTGDERFPIPLAAHIATEVARALAYVHDFRGLGLVHRDLTPSNVMFAQTGEVKVIDFGIAKATLADDTLTRPHILVGKPFWTAPEVVAGQKVDRRADLYALGLLLWYLLAGNDPEERVDSASGKLPPPSTFNPEVSGDLDGIVLRAIHPNPNRRFQSATELIDAVKPFIPAGYDGTKELAHQVFRYESALKKDALANEVARARPLLEATISPRPARRRKAVLVVLVVAATVAAAGILLRPRPERGEPANGSGGAAPPLTQQPAPLPSSPPVLPPAPPSVPSTKTSSSHAPAATVAVPAPPDLKAIPRPARTPREATPPTVTAPQPGPDALMAAARESFDDENFAAALKLARAAAQQGAGAKAYLLIGTCLSLAKDYEGARTAFERALALSPENVEAKRLLEQLQRKLPNKTP